MAVSGRVSISIQVNSAAFRQVASRQTKAYMDRKAQVIARRARQLAPQRDMNEPGARRRGPKLKDTITVRSFVSARGPVVLVGSTSPYARYVHEGTPRHIILGRPKLHFYATGYGRFIVVSKVNHPGIRKPVPFLRKAMEEEMRRK